MVDLSKPVDTELQYGLGFDVVGNWPEPILDPVVNTNEYMVDFDDYFHFVTCGVNLDTDSYRERLLLAAAGLGGEGGEVIDMIKKECFHGKPQSREDYVLELGDVLWYWTLALMTKGITPKEVIEKNIKKLTERYPHKHKVA